MRFAFVSTMSSSPWGGSEELWSQAAIELQRTGHDVRAAVMSWPRLSDKVSALAQHDIELSTYPSFRVGPIRRLRDRLSLGYRRSYGRLRRFHPDLVVISLGWNSGGFDWAKLCRAAAIPYVMNLQCNSDIWWFGENFEEAVATYTGARRIFCLSRNNLDLLRLQLAEPLPNAELVWNPFNVSTEPAPPWPDEANGMRLACVSRIELQAKGHDLLLRTLAQPEWRDRPVELNLYGAGPDEIGLRRLCGMLQLNNVHFRGHVNDIRKIWEQNHLLVLPSRYEGLPLALVEAMWCGRPAMVTDVGGNAELCIDGETGFVAPAATLPSVSHALERTWDARGEWNRLGQAARSRVEALVPIDPIALFCRQLTACAPASSEARAGKVMFAR